MAASGADKMGYRCGSARQRRLPPHSRAATLYLQPPYRSQSAQGGTKRRRNEFSHAASANYFSNARANQPRARIIVGWRPNPRHRSDGKLDRQNLARRTLRSINRRPHRTRWNIARRARGRFAAAGEETAAYEVLRSVPPAVNRHDRQNRPRHRRRLPSALRLIHRQRFRPHAHRRRGRHTNHRPLGPSWPHLYGPWGDHTTFVRTPETFAELTNYPGYNAGTCGCLMNSLTVENVWQATQQFWLAHKSKTGAV